VYHLFFEVPVFASIWHAICKWIGVSSVLHNEGVHHIDQFTGLIDGN
jgi:hypothetical protein